MNYYFHNELIRLRLWDSLLSIAADFWQFADSWFCFLIVGLCFFQFFLEKI